MDYRWRSLYARTKCSLRASYPANDVQAAWNIEADIEDTKVFHYPVANESIHPEDPYEPNF